MFVSGGIDPCAGGGTGMPMGMGMGMSLCDPDSNAAVTEIIACLMSSCSGEGQCSLGFGMMMTPDDAACSDAGSLGTDAGVGGGCETCLATACESEVSACAAN